MEAEFSWKLLEKHFSTIVVVVRLELELELELLIPETADVAFVNHEVTACCEILVSCRFNYLNDEC